MDKHRINPVIKAHQQYQRGKRETFFNDQDEKWQVPMKGQFTCLMKNRNQSDHSSKEVCRRLAVNEPFDGK
ncbi:MAG: hypothetical protein CVT99_04645 [Bacteroidetes bacterium HGW-Bacteroidetes-16]|nr:MAG: hypothetical protein CVT99_04645 [Bacteroidetes bacterium HGW-Bacteroidetes-16]